MARAKMLALTDREIADLETIIRQRTNQAQIVDRSKMLLYKSRGMSNVDQQTAAGLGGNFHAAFLFLGMAPSPGDNGTEGIRGVVLAQSIHADKTLLVSSQQRGYFTVFNLIPGLTQKFQQFIKALGFLCQSFVNSIANLFAVGRLLLIPQPLVVGLALALGIGHNGISALFSMQSQTVSI